MKCGICERGCVIQAGGIGACGMYGNKEETITELFPDKYLITTPISVETMPMLHFYPGGKFLQISTAGCNFECAGCISTVIVREMDAASKILHKLSPAEVIKKAVDNECCGIVFLMNDPLASFLTFVEVAKTAKKHGLLVGFSSNGYFTRDSLNRIAEVLDFVNIGVKGLSDQAYRQCGGSTPEPVLRNIKALYERGIHVEVSCIHCNHNQEELVSLSRKISEISREIPLQIMRFIPLESADPLLEPAIRETEELRNILVKHLAYVYVFNSPGTEYLSTFCPECSEVIFKRDFYGPMGAKLRAAGVGLAEGNTCPNCGRKLNFIGSGAKELYREEGFQGGYPFTRALEMIEAILIAIGADDKKKVLRAWEEVLSGNGLTKLHHDIQNPETYISLIRHFGKLIQHDAAAEKLAVYMETKLTVIKQALVAIKKKPRVYYAMGKPNFCLNGERFENQLVEVAGGISENKKISGSGRPGVGITYDILKSLNPEVIFISSFLSSTVEDFYHEFPEDMLAIDAVKNHRIYTQPGPCWDFGSPRWILGLMYIANVLHPKMFNFDIISEAKMFYREFYNLDFNVLDCNRSFGKPSSKWRWKA